MQIHSDTNIVHAAGLERAIAVGVDADIPLLVLGRPGVGKTQITIATAERMGFAPLAVVSSMYLPEFFSGHDIPVTQADGTSKVEQLVPALFEQVVALREKTGKPVFLFQDEIDKCPDVIQAPLLQMVLEKRVGNVKLPADTYVCAAGNGEDDGSFSNPLSRALLNRFMVFDFAGPTQKEFERHAAKQAMHPVVQAFAAQHYDVVMSFDAAQERNCTPRSMEALSRALHSDKMPHDMRMTVSSACIGAEAAAKLEAMLTVYDNLTPLDDILKDPQGAPLPPPENLIAGFMTFSSLPQMLRRRVSEATANGETDVAALRKKMVMAGWTYAKRNPAKELSVLFLNNLHGDQWEVILSEDLAETSENYADVLAEIVNV